MVTVSAPTQARKAVCHRIWTSKVSWHFYPRNSQKLSFHCNWWVAHLCIMQYFLSFFISWHTGKAKKKWSRHTLSFFIFLELTRHTATNSPLPLTNQWSSPKFTGHTWDHSCHTNMPQNCDWKWLRYIITNVVKTYGYERLRRRYSTFMFYRWQG